MQPAVAQRYNLQDFGKMGRRINIKLGRDVHDTRGILDLFIELRDHADLEIAFLEEILNVKGDQ